MVLPALALTIMATKLYVDPQGNDAAQGTASQPLKTFEGAQLAARKLHGNRVTVVFAAGVYRLDKLIVLGPEDSGMQFIASKGAKVILSGADTFQPKWQPAEGKIVRCAVPKGFDADQIYINGEKKTLARYPNKDASIRIFNGYAKDAISPDRVATWKDPAGGYFHAMHAYMWGGFQFRILGKDASGKLRMEGGWQNNRQADPHPEYRYVEGIREELDAPGEWFLDRKEGALYYYPEPGESLNAPVEGALLKGLIEFNGAKEVTLSGFTFQRTARTFMETKEPLLRSDWTIYRGGAALFTNSKDCTIEDSTFEDIGGNAVFVSGKNKAISIRRCLIKNIGASGVAFVGDPKAVRNPLFEYNQNQSFASLDKTPGPKTDDYPTDCRVEDCIITHIGETEKQATGVEISMSRRITVKNCSIYHVPRAGINIGDHCWGGHVIQDCDVFDTVLETGDHGAFNSWGRDRYWALTDVDMNKGEHPELALLDAVEPNYLLHNRWQCFHGWDIDLDDGSSNYVIRDNLCLNGGIKNREGFSRLVENNIMVGNSFHPHVWFLNSGDVFRKNIVFEPYKPIQVPKPWGREVDHNFLVGGSAKSLSDLSGRDEHSGGGDAMFVDPRKGDYGVRAASPVFKLGFKNFAMNSFGVRAPWLRAIVLAPTFASNERVASEVESAEWLGAKVKNLVQPEELSATGLGEGLGVYVSEVKVGSPAALLGLRAVDVILAVNDVSVRSVGTLTKQTSVKSLKIWRNQQAKTLRSSAPSPGE